MRKLAFECAGSFEMPTLKMVGLEKDTNILFANNVFVPQTNYNGLTQSQKLQLALQEELDKTVSAAAIPTATPEPAAE